MFRTFRNTNIIAEILIAVYCIILGTLSTLYKWEYTQVAEIATNLLEAILLIVGVFYMRRQINGKGVTIANEKLIVVHLINFIVWSILFTSSWFFAIRSSKPAGWTMSEKKQYLPWLKNQFSF